jgi:hypothetical protein
MYTDTLFSKIISINGNNCAQVFCNEDFVKVIPMKSKAHAGRALTEFAEDVGVPLQIVADGAAELSGGNTEFMQEIRRLHILLRHTEPHTPRQNFAERIIGELKRKWRQRMAMRTIPSRLWDYGLIYESEIMSRMARGTERRTGVERLTGDTVDISEWLDFEFFDLVWYLHEPGADNNPRLGRWIGISHRIGSDMCYWVLNEKGHTMSRTTVQHVTELEQQTPDIQKKITEFDRVLKERLDDTNHIDKSDAAPFYLQDVDVSNDEVQYDMAIEQEDYTDEAY